MRLAIVVLLAPAVAHADGPRTTAFAQRCGELRADAPDTRCTRLRVLRAGGHPIEVHRATASKGDLGETVSVFVAIQYQDGWFLPDPLVLPTHGGNGMGTVEKDGDIEAIDVTRAGARVVVTARERWDTTCTPCQEAFRHRVAFETHVMICGIGASGVPACASPRVFVGSHGRFPRVRIARDVIVVRDSDTDGRVAIDLGEPVAP